MPEDIHWILGLTGLVCFFASVFTMGPALRSKRVERHAQHWTIWMAPKWWYLLAAGMQLAGIEMILHVPEDFDLGIRLGWYAFPWCFFCLLIGMLGFYRIDLAGKRIQFFHITRFWRGLANIPLVEPPKLYLYSFSTRRGIFYHCGIETPKGFFKRRPLFTFDDRLLKCRRLAEELSQNLGIPLVNELSKEVLERHSEELNQGLGDSNSPEPKAPIEIDKSIERQKGLSEVMYRSKKHYLPLIGTTFGLLTILGTEALAYSSGDGRDVFMEDAEYFLIGLFFIMSIGDIFRWRTNESLVISDTHCTHRFKHYFLIPRKNQVPREKIEEVSAQSNRSGVQIITDDQMIWCFLGLKEPARLQLARAIRQDLS